MAEEDSQLMNNLLETASFLAKDIKPKIQKKLDDRDRTANRLLTDSELFEPFIRVCHIGMRENEMISYLYKLGDEIYRTVKKYENENSVELHKERLFIVLSDLSILRNDEIHAMVYWELAQQEYEHTNKTTPIKGITPMEALFNGSSIISGRAQLEYDENKLIKLLKSSFGFIGGFDTVLCNLSDLHKAHFLSCGIKQVHILGKLRFYYDSHIIKVFAQELVNSLCLFNESLLKDKGLQGNTIGELMDAIFITYADIGQYLGQSRTSTGVYSNGKASFYSNYKQFVKNIEENIIDPNELKAHILYALHQLRNEALHSFDDKRKYYNDAELFEKTIGLLFICVSVINTL